MAKKCECGHASCFHKPETKGNFFFPQPRNNEPTCTFKDCRCLRFVSEE